MAKGDITLTVEIAGVLSGGDPVTPFRKTKTYTSVADLIDRHITVPTTEVTALQVGAAVAGAQLSTLNCVVIYNLDASNYVTIGIKDAGAKSVYLRLDAGEQIILSSDKLDVDDDAGGVFAAFADIDTITLQANTAAVRCRMIAF